MEVWFLQIGAQRKGPFSSAGLREALRLGKIDPFCDVFHVSNPDLVKPLLEWDEVFDSRMPDVSSGGLAEANSKEASKKILKVLGSTEQSEKNGLRRSDNLINQTIEPINFSFDHSSAPENTSLSDSRTSQSEEKALLAHTSKVIQETRPQHNSNQGKTQSISPEAPGAQGRNQSPNTPSKSRPALQTEVNPSEEGTVKRKRKCVYIVHYAGHRHGPFTSFEVFEQYKNGNFKSGALVGKGSLEKTVSIERFVAVYQSGKKTNFFPTEFSFKGIAPSRLTAALMASAIAIIATFYAFSLTGRHQTRPTLLAKTRLQSKEITPSEKPKRSLKELATPSPISTSKSSERPLEPLERNIDNHRKQNRLTVNPRPSTSSRMSAKSYPSMIKVAGTSAIAQALMGKNDGAEVTIRGLEFDRAAVRNCRGMCEVLFIDSSGAAIQVVFDGASHRNSLFSKSGRVSIVGFLTAGKQKVILKRTY